jgi:hypothetical protein
MPYNGSLFDGVYEPKRLIVLDKNNPYRIANGTVMDVFTNMQMAISMFIF